MDFFELAKRKTQERLQAKLASQSKPTPPPSPDLQNEERETTSRPIAEPAKVVVSADPIPTTQSERTAKFDSIEQAPQSALFRRTDKPSNIGNFPKCLSYTFEGLIQHLCRICFKDLWIRDRETAKQNALQTAKQLYKDNYIDFYLP
jgi:hypothetical protein